jgi:XTP/dITP diphosphohydrolase
MKLLVATANPGKVREFVELLGPALPEGTQLVSLTDVGLPAPEETGATFAENAALKARAGAVGSGLWTLGDDSGLCVDALDGGPGLRSSRYAPTDAERRTKLLAALLRTPEGRRRAHFECALALCAPDGRRLYRSEGRVDGTIGGAPRGSNGFGYDPIFLPDEAAGRTLAELNTLQKNEMSHRGRAVKRMLPLIGRLLREGDLPDA